MTNETRKRLINKLVNRYALTVDENTAACYRLGWREAYEQFSDEELIAFMLAGKNEA